MSKRPAPVSLDSLSLPTTEYVELLRKLIAESEHLQNNPAQGLHPKEVLAAAHVLERLGPFTTEKGGLLEVEQVCFKEGRANLIIKYPGASDKSIAFVGSHMDVVPANPETWERDPFTLTVEGNNLYGRGTTDCLGHVALVTEMMVALAQAKPTLQRTVTAVMIANEENGEVQNVGVDQLMATGKLDHIKSGPVFWVDVADSHPCVGTAGSINWHLKAKGKLFHSGLPHKAVNALELCNAACAELQNRFYKAVPPCDEEKKWFFQTPSTLKPTQVRCSPGSQNQIPPWVEISGDIRLTPFYDVVETKKVVEEIVKDMNENITSLPTFGPMSKYEIEDCRGELEIRWAEGYLEGVACSLSSPGHKALCKATMQVRGEAKPYSICGSLPLVRDLQRGGFDVQMIGFGLMARYHADNEYCTLSDMQKGFDVLVRTIAILEEEG